MRTLIGLIFGTALGIYIEQNYSVPDVRVRIFSFSFFSFFFFLVLVEIHSFNHSESLGREEAFFAWLLPLNS